MKKFLSVFLASIFFISSVSQGLSVFAYNVPAETDLDVFSRELSQLIRENDKDLYIEDNSEIIEDIIIKAEQFFNNISPQDEFSDLPEDAFLTNRLIVKSNEKIDYYGAIDCVSGYNDLYILQYDNETAAKNAYKYYLTCDNVEYVEPDIIVNATIDDYPGEDLRDDEANIFDEVVAESIKLLSDKIGFSDIKESLAEKIEDDYVLVAVLDSGVDTDHELLIDRLVEGRSNFSTTGESNSCEDDYGHGTHVAGIIANNTLSNVKIKPYKVLNEYGQGSLSSIANSIDMAVADGADVINLSLSARGKSNRMTEAVDNAVANDVNVVVAAGNNSLDLDNVYITPACIESAITVSATDNSDDLADFSNYDNTIDIAAPGVNIESSYLDNKYIGMSGTSMSAPQVTAGIAIIQSLFEDKPAAECEEMIKEYAIKINEQRDTNHFGAGLLFLKYLVSGMPETAEPVFSVDSCSFRDSFNVSLSCPDSDASIYYMILEQDFFDILDNFDDINFDNLKDINDIDNFDNPEDIVMEYTKPITISVDSKVFAFAIEKGKKRSSVVFKEYDRIADSDDEYYEINILGQITGYYGPESTIFIPDVIRGVTVKGIASSAFENNKRLKYVILPDRVKKINKKAFYGCSSLVFVSGNSVEEVDVSAFENSSIESVDFPDLNTVRKNAFSNCSNLNSINLSKVEYIGESSFKGTSSLTDIVCDSLTEMLDSAFYQSGLCSFSASELTDIGLNTFSDCHELISVSLPQITELPIGTFKNCTSLKTVDAVAVTDIGANAFRNCGIEKYFGRNVEKIGNHAFSDCSQLAKVILPLTKTSGTNAFLNCISLQVAMLPAIEALNNNSFSNCPQLLMLYLPSVKTVSKSAFKDSYVEFLKFSNVKKIESLPDTLQGLLLPSSVVSITASTPDTDFIVYGYEDSYAQQYANDHGKEFKTIPSIVYESTNRVSTEEKYIIVYALGFKCKYQWYRNETVSNVGGTLIEGATFFYYEPSPNDESASYYCVISCEDGSNEYSVTTSPIENAPEYRYADLSVYYELRSEADSLNRSLYSDELLNKLDILLSVDLSEVKYVNQDIVDNYIEELKNTLDEIKASFVMGDLNGDCVVSAIDVRLAMKHAQGINELSGKFLFACDMDGNGEVSVSDIRDILQKGSE